MDRQEAIQIIKKNRPNGRHMLSEALEFLIPELKEDEDERIRKKFIKALKECGFTHFNDEFTVQEALAWLKKQGEQTKIEALRTEYEKGRADTLSEMKSSWSEEDEKMLDAIIDFFENGTVKLQHDLSLYASLLKSLKERMKGE